MSSPPVGCSLCRPAPAWLRNSASPARTVSRSRKPFHLRSSVRSRRLPQLRHSGSRAGSRATAPGWAAAPCVLLAQRGKGCPPGASAPRFLGPGVRTVLVPVHVPSTFQLPLVDGAKDAASSPVSAAGCSYVAGRRPGPALRAARQLPPALQPPCARRGIRGARSSSFLRSTSTAAPNSRFEAAKSIRGPSKLALPSTSPAARRGFRSAIEPRPQTEPFRRPTAIPSDPAPRSRQVMSNVSAFAKTSWVNLLGRLRSRRAFARLLRSGAMRRDEWLKNCDDLFLLSP